MKALLAVAFWGEPCVFDSGCRRSRYAFDDDSDISLVPPDEGGQAAIIVVL
jgi:hypothetical protein